MTAVVAAPPAAARADVPAPRRQVDQWVALASIPVFYTLFGVVYVVLTRLMPPPPAHTTAAGAVHFLASHRTRLQVGIAILLLVIGMSALSGGLVVVQMKRMRGVGHWLAYSYLGALAVATVPGCLVNALTFATAALRPERDPHLVFLLYDLGMLSFVGSLGCFIVQYLVFAIAILRDKNHIFPRWLGYMSIWALVTEIVAAPCWIFTRGPFAWNGLLAFYQGTIIWVAWQICLTVLLYRAIRRQEADEAVAAGVPVPVGIPRP